jgi:hypothetical protein
MARATYQRRELNQRNSLRCRHAAFTTHTRRNFRQAVRMRFIAVLVLVLGCNHDESHTHDASMDRTPCEAAYQATLDRSCTVPADCALVSHNDCCGTVRIGVHAGTEAAATSAEATYAACFDCGARGCNHADIAEDGEAPQGSQTIVATCVANRCTSVVQ